MALEAETEMKVASDSGLDTERLEPYRVELHVHLDGAVSTDVLWKAAERKPAVLPKRAMASRKAFDEFVSCASASVNLKEMLTKMYNYLPLLQDDLESLRHMCEDFCRRQYASRVYYTEVRYCPQLFCDTLLKPTQVVEAICKYLSEASLKYGIVVKSILCCMREWKGDARGDAVVDLAIAYKSQGVVGVDLAGNEPAASCEDYAHVFQRAKDEGLKITIHAGEACGSESVIGALDKLHATRIGHGYHSLDDAAVAARVLKERVHLECCPSSSIITGAIKGIPLSGEDADAWRLHPMAVFARDGYNLGLNTDDPSVMNIDLDGEFRVCMSKMGFSKERIARCWIDMAEAAFVDADEKKAIVAVVQKGIDDYWLKCDADADTETLDSAAVSDKASVAVMEETAVSAEAKVGLAASDEREAVVCEA